MYNDDIHNTLAAFQPAPQAQPRASSRAAAARALGEPEIRQGGGVRRRQGAAQGKPLGLISMFIIVITITIIIISSSSIGGEPRVPSCESPRTRGRSRTTVPWHGARR